MTIHVRRPRKRLLIDPAAQGAVVRQQLLHWTITLVVVLASLLLSLLFEDGQDQSLAYHLTTMCSRYGLLVVTLLCVFPLFVYDSLRLTHRMAGPVFALQVALRKLAKGERIHEVAFRKNDFWKQLSHDVNQIASRLDQQQVVAEGDARRKPDSGSLTT